MTRNSGSFILNDFIKNCGQLSKIYGYEFLKKVIKFSIKLNKLTFNKLFNLFYIFIGFISSNY